MEKEAQPDKEPVITQTFDFNLLSETGMLWLINRVVFHPRGYSFSINKTEGGEVAGWGVSGSGKEPWTMPPEVEDDCFSRAEQFLESRRE